jgi:hypothetical protein
MTRLLFAGGEFLVVVVPGVAASAALLGRHRLTFAGRLALSYVAGFALIALISFGLAAASILSLASLVVSLIVITAGLSVVSFRNGDLRAWWRGLVEGIREQPWEVALGIAVLVAIAFVRLRYSPLTSVISNPTFRYWADAADIATSGSIPQETLQWGGVYPPSAMKNLLNCFNAAMYLMFGSNSLAAIGGLTWLAAIGLGASVWWFATEVGLRLTGPLLVLWLTANKLWVGNDITQDLNSFRAENSGRMVAFAAFALSVNALHGSSRHSRYLLLAGGALFGVAACVHLVPAVIILCLFAFYSLYFVIADAFRRTEGKGWLGRSVSALRERSFVTSIGWLAATAAVTLLLAGSVVLLARGDVALNGTEGSQAYDLGEFSVDPTLFYVTGRSVPIAEAQTTDWFTPPDALVGQYVSRSLGEPPDRPWAWLIGFGGVAVVIGVMAQARLRPIVFAALGLTAVIIGVTLVFSYTYDLMALANFGPRRLFDYASAPLILVGFVLIESLLVRLQKVEPALAGPVSAVLVVGLGAYLLPALEPGRGLVPKGNAAVADYEWVRDNLPCHARIVSNQRTDATYQLLTGRVGVIEGMGPHLRPEMLLQINDLLERNREFFTRPAENERYLIEEGIDYVALVRDRKNKGVLSVPPKAGKFDDVEFLELVHEGERTNFYRVVGVDTGGDFPDPNDFSGYTCRQGSIG